MLDTADRRGAAIVFRALSASRATGSVAQSAEPITAFIYII